MSMLVDFLCRFGFGLSLGLVCTPATLVPSGFYRVNILVVMGLATFAALVASSAVPSAAVWMLAGAAALVAWVGSVAWFTERRGAGLVACAVTGLAMGAATAAVASLVPGGEPGPFPAFRHLLSGAVVGMAVHAMLLGHWYLNAPGMSVDALRRSIDVALVVWGVQLAVALVALTAGGTIHASQSQTAFALGALRWLAGLVGLPVLLWMSRETLAIPNTQSATGILYVACLAAIVGELAGQLLAASG